MRVYLSAKLINFCLSYNRGVFIDENNSLIGGTAEGEVWILQFLYIGTVYHSFEVRKYFIQDRRAENLFVSEAGIEPDSVSQIMDFAGEKCCFFRKEEWVAPGKGDIEVFFLYYFQQPGEGNVCSILGIPCLRIVATGTSVSTTSQIYGSAKTGAVYCRAPDYIYYFKV